MALPRPRSTTPRREVGGVEVQQLRHKMVLTTYSDSSAREFGAKKATASAPVDIWAQWLGTISVGEQEEVVGAAEQAIVRTRFMQSVKPGSTLQYKDRVWEVVRVAPEGDQFSPKMMRMYVQSQEAR